MTDSQTPKMPSGWYDDPTGVGEARYWDGTAWTQSVSTRGITVSAPIESDKAGVPPVPGSEFRVTATPPPIPTPTYIPPVSPPPQRTPQRSSAGLIGIIVALGAAVIAVIVLVNALGSDDDDEPDPSVPTEAPPATEAPATDAPAEGDGGDEGG